MTSHDPPHQVRYSRMRARCATSSTSAGTRAIFRAHVAILRAQPRLGRSSCGAKCCACATRAATRRWPPSCWRSNWAASRSGSSWGLSKREEATSRGRHFRLLYSLSGVSREVNSLPPPPPPINGLCKSRLCRPCHLPLKHCGIRISGPLSGPRARDLYTRCVEHK